MNKKFLVVWFLVLAWAGCDKEKVREDELIAKGRALFNDTKFSANGSISCATCHPGGDMDHKKWLLPVYPESIATPTLFGINGTAPYLWLADGGTQIDSLTKIVITVIMGGTVTDDELRALTAYQLSLKVPSNPWVNDDGSLTDAQERGKVVFEHQGHCISCHSGEKLYTNLKKIQVQKGQPQIDVPSLRWVFATAPYFHNHKYESLMDVVNHYSDTVLTAQMTAWNWNTLGIFDINLTEQEKSDLVEYLRTL